MVTPLTNTVGNSTELNKVRSPKANEPIILAVDLEATKEREVTLYTIPAAAAEAGVEERTLRRAVVRGAVKAIKIEGSPIHVVTLEDVLEWKNNRLQTKPGRPKSDK